VKSVRPAAYVAVLLCVAGYLFLIGVVIAMSPVPTTPHHPTHTTEGTHQ
jgi:hypothetical protein